MVPGVTNTPPRVLVAGATGYLGKYVTRELKKRGYWVRVFTRSIERLEKPGPFTAPCIGQNELDGVGPPLGKRDLRSYFEDLLAEERK